MHRRHRLAAAALVASVGWSGLAAAQGRVVVSNDEWLTTSGYVDVANPAGTPGNSEELVTNVSTWFGGGNYLAFSNNFALNNGNLSTFMTTGLGASWTVSTGASEWANLASYDAVFLAGPPGAAYDANLLANYVRGGGNVVVLGGTGTFGGGAAAEAAFWTPFLGQFGLQFLAPYNGLSGVVSTAGYAAQGPFGDDLFTGVSGIYMNNGNNLEIGAGPAPAGVTVQVFRDGEQRGLFAAAEVSISTVPEPGSILLVASGLAVLGLAARRRASRA